MTDELHPPDGPAAERAGSAPADPPDEPFACPHCGQMLAPTCRVCVVCHEPIDPAQIRRPPAPVLPEVPAPAPVGGPAQALPGGEAKPAVPPVRYPWRMLLLVLGLTWLGAAAALMLLGLEQARVLVTGVQVLTSVWVFFDARQKHLPKPFHWGLGTLFLWIIFFPWYLARRKRPAAPCPFVEREPSPLARMILLVLALFFLIALVAALLHGPR